MNIYQDWDLLREANVDLEFATQGKLPASPSHRARAVKYTLDRIDEWPDSFTRLLAGTFCDEPFEEQLNDFLQWKGLQNHPEILIPTKYEAFLFQLRNANRLLTPQPQTINILLRNDRVLILPGDTDKLKEQISISPLTGDKIWRSANVRLEQVTSPMKDQLQGQLADLLNKIVVPPTRPRLIVQPEPTSGRARDGITEKESVADVVTKTVTTNGGQDAPARPRRVRVGITEKESADDVTDGDVLDKTQPLRPTQSYLLRIDISAETGGTNVVNDVAIDEQVLKRIPEGAQLDVVTYSSDVEIDQNGEHRGRQIVHLL
ncbi:MAG: hypothetical protein ABI614_06595, partial [Planctomycetota bacterium]